jgi:ribosomal protein S18 acetylase RimI-like enzyme
LVSTLQGSILDFMKKPEVVDIRSSSESDAPWIIDLVKEQWGSQKVVSRGVIHDIEHLPGFIAWRAGDRVGLLTYKVDGREIEIVTLDSLEKRVGIGSALISHLIGFAAQRGTSRIWVITTNDNTQALSFYQIQGFQLIALHKNAIEQSRLLKPEISLFGNHGIPIRDELELEMHLSP